MAPMINEILTSGFILVLLLLPLGEGAVEPKVVKNGLDCSDSIGSCKSPKDCYNECVARYPGPSTQMSCATNPVSECMCFYECPKAPPPPPRCNASGGLCSETCNQQCCDDTCATKYPNGAGVCSFLGGQQICQCTYDC